MEKTFDLDRFIKAQKQDYQTALAEMKNGQKTSHWIWYIFPQEKGLGRSDNSKYYGLDGKAEAKAYIEHPILGERLREICSALLTHKGKDIRDIMGSGIDARKLKSSMKIFNSVCPNDIFEEVLKTFYRR